jgi:hypothetical protein
MEQTNSWDSSFGNFSVRMMAPDDWSGHAPDVRAAGSGVASVRLRPLKFIQ